MDILTNWLSIISGYVWGPYTLTLLVGTGVYLSIRLVFLQFRMLPFALKQAFWPHKKQGNTNQKGDVSHFGALMTALSATIGTGNIAGVATAIVAGGPGAIFWMWISALFGMATKYSECILAVKYRVTNSRGEMSGGPMYYIERGIKWKWSKYLAMVFALFGTFASFGIGSSVQANSIAQSIHTSFNIPTVYTGIVLAILTAVVVLGGVKSIARAASWIVPFMAIVYIVSGITILVLNSHLIRPALDLIFSNAFSFRAVSGGMVFNVIRYGVARGVFSNEAGMGSAPIAAAAAKTDHPARQALVSMTGTFIDTIVVCSITGMILVMGFIMNNHSFNGQNGASLTTLSFNQLLPGPGGWIVTFGLVFFAYSTTLGWSYYGEKCASYLFGDKFVSSYRIIYIITVYLGTIVHLDIVWLMADVFNGLMSIPNLIALLLLSNVIVRETQDFMTKRKTGELY